MAPEIQARIAKYAASEIRFNLLAVIRDRQEALGQQLTAAESKMQAIIDKLAGAAGAAAMETDGAAGNSAGQQQLQLPDDEAALQRLLVEAEGEVFRCLPGLVMQHVCVLNCAMHTVVWQKLLAVCAIPAVCICAALLHKCMKAGISGLRVTLTLTP